MKGFLQQNKALVFNLWPTSQIHPTELCCWACRAILGSKLRRWENSARANCNSSGNHVNSCYHCSLPPHFWTCEEPHKPDDMALCTVLYWHVGSGLCMGLLCDQIWYMGLLPRYIWRSGPSRQIGTKVWTNPEY